MKSSQTATGTASNALRWTMLVVGILSMVMIANLQYAWTLFVNPISAQFGWSRAAIQVAFTIFILCETWLVPFEGWLIDKFGLRLLLLIGGVLVGIAWVINAYATTLGMLYLGGALGGIGAGIVYGGCVGNALKWFPDRRGLAAGLTAAGYGLGSALTIIPIANMIKDRGYESAFFAFGIGQGVIVVILALILRGPREGEVPIPQNVRVAQTRREYTPMETIRQPAFWLMYVMFVLVSTGGLMATAQLAPYAKDLKVADIPVTLLGITLTALIFGKVIDNLTNGLCRPFFGWVSDFIGRENTMFIAFFIEGIGILVLWRFASHPVAFVLLSGLVFFAWGEIFSLFPSTSADLFGRKYATVNYGLLYTAKGTSAILVPLGNVLHHATGDWTLVLVIAAIFNFVAAGMALWALKPVRVRVLKEATASA